MISESTYACSGLILITRPIQLTTGECSALNSIATLASFLPASSAASSEVFASSWPNSALGFSGWILLGSRTIGLAGRAWTSAQTERWKKKIAEAPCSCAPTMPSARQIHKRLRAKRRVLHPLSRLTANRGSRACWSQNGADDLGRQPVNFGLQTAARCSHVLLDGSASFTDLLLGPGARLRQSFGAGLLRLLPARFLRLEDGHVELPAGAPRNPGSWPRRPRHRHGLSGRPPPCARGARPIYASAACAPASCKWHRAAAEELWSEWLRAVIRLLA